MDPKPGDPCLAARDLVRLGERVSTSVPGVGVGLSELAQEYRPDIKVTALGPDRQHHVIRAG